MLVDPTSGVIRCAIFCLIPGVVLGLIEANWTAAGHPLDSDFWWDPSQFEPDCTEESDGTFTITEGLPLCVVHVSGADEMPGRVPGSIDGTYKSFACHDGFPIFYRIDSPHDDERVLWFSERFRDWNINKGLVAQPAEVMAFGGDGDAEPRPQMVLSSKWWFVRSAESRKLEDMFMQSEEFRIDCLETDPDADL